MPPDAIDELKPVDKRHPEVGDDDVGQFGVERASASCAEDAVVTRAPAASSTSATSASASRSSSTAST